MSVEMIYRFFGIREQELHERLEELLIRSDITAELSSCEEDTVLRVTAPDEQSAQTVHESILSDAGVYLYSREDISLEEQAVALLKEKGKCVAVAESCTGGLLASRLTAVPGCSAVFGTGVVSYSWDCKQKQLGVSALTLQEYGAVSPQTAKEMAVGIRKSAGADIGISITGEAGPQAAEAQPVGTVYIALADAKRIWVKELQLDASTYDRNAIRRVSAAHALDLLRRYLQAYPAVMAGGERHVLSDHIKHRKAAVRQNRFLETLLPWRGNSKRRVLKLTVWALVLALLISGMLLLYHNILSSDTNRELQGDLADLYWENTSDLTEDTMNDSAYPKGMKAQFRGLYDINSDIAGWVRIPDTSVNYPVMAYADRYYVNHSFNDQYSIYGQPHFDEQNTLDMLDEDSVLIVHGNNTRDEQMFSSLLSYRRIAYLREHPTIELDTLYTAARWEIFAVMLVNERERDSDFEYAQCDFADDAAFQNYIAQIKRRSLFLSNLEITAQDRVLLLVTDAQQEYGFSGARLVIAARCMTQGQATATYRSNTQVLMPSVMHRNTTSTTQMTTTITTGSPFASTGTTMTATTQTTERSDDSWETTTGVSSALTSSNSTKTTAIEPPITDTTTAAFAEQSTTSLRETNTSATDISQSTTFTSLTVDADAPVTTDTTAYTQTIPQVPAEPDDSTPEMERENYDYIRN